MCRWATPKRNPKVTLVKAFWVVGFLVLFIFGGPQKTPPFSTIPRGCKAKFSKLPLPSNLKRTQVVILHTGESHAVKMCQKLKQTSEALISEKVQPSQTADRLVGVISQKLELSPLTYFLKPFTGKLGEARVEPFPEFLTAIGLDL